MQNSKQRTRFGVPAPLYCNTCRWNLSVWILKTSREFPSFIYNAPISLCIIFKLYISNVNDFKKRLFCFFRRILFFFKPPPLPSPLPHRHNLLSISFFIAFIFVLRYTFFPIIILLWSFRAFEIRNVSFNYFADIFIRFPTKDYYNNMLRTLCEEFRQIIT